MLNSHKIYTKLLILSPIAFCSCSHLTNRDPDQKQNPERLLELGKTVEATEKFEWHLKNTKTKKAWEISKGDKNIVVAIIDTGIDKHHPDLKDNLWVNQKEKNGLTGYDDDQNGFIDDIHGWNFADNSSNIRDYHGHGTHVAGIIGGKGNVCKPGVSPQVSLMILKYYSPKASGSVNLRNTVRSIHYAIQNGAHIINFSGGGPKPNEEERKAIDLALEKNILFVTAGGNEKSNTEKNPYYPASYRLANILSVGASDPEDRHALFSNQGKAIVAHAPGTKLYSTLPGKTCGFLTGTSQSTPLFTGGAVLVKAKKNLVKPSQIIQYLSKTSDFKWVLRNKSQTGGRANFYRALGSEHLNVSVTGDSVKYSNTDVGQVSEDQESSRKNSEISSLQKYFQAPKNLKNKARKPASTKTPHLEWSDPSKWTKIFIPPAAPRPSQEK